MDHNKLWKILKEMGIPDHLICLLRNLCADKEATVRTGHETTDWFQIGNGVRQGCVLSPCLFNLYAEYIMRNTGLDEAQGGIEIARRNINNLRYVDNTTIMAEGEEELKNVLMRVKKLALSSTFRKLRSCHPVPSLHAKRWGYNGNNNRLYFLGSKITVDGDCSLEIKRHLLLGRKVNDQPRQHIQKQRHYFANKGLSSQGYGFSSGHVWM